MKEAMVPNHVAAKASHEESHVSVFMEGVVLGGQVIQAL